VNPRDGLVEVIGIEITHGAQAERSNCQKGAQRGRNRRANLSIEECAVRQL